MVKTTATSNGGSPHQIWDEILEHSVLGKYAPNPVIERGIFQTAQGLDDSFLAEVVIIFVRKDTSMDRAYKQ